MSHELTLSFSTDLEMEELADGLGRALGTHWTKREDEYMGDHWAGGILGIHMCLSRNLVPSGHPFMLTLMTGFNCRSRPFQYELMAIVLHCVAHDLARDGHRFDGVVYDDNEEPMTTASMRTDRGYPEVWLEPQRQVLDAPEFFRDLWPGGFRWIRETHAPPSLGDARDE